MPRAPPLVRNDSTAPAEHLSAYEAMRVGVEERGIARLWTPSLPNFATTF